MLAGDYAFTDSRLLGDPFHEYVVNRKLARSVPALLSDILDEVTYAFDTVWGGDTKEWKEVKVYESVLLMVSQTINRMVVGYPLCRNEDFLLLARGFTKDVGRTLAILRLTPRWLRPLVGPLSALLNHSHYRKTARYTLPLIRERLSHYEMLQQSREMTRPMSDDFLSWSISVASAEGHTEELTAERLSRRLLPIETAGIYPTSATITNCLLDLLSSDPSLQYLDTIRQQSSMILGQNGGQWTKAGIAAATRADSAIRESMRLSPIMTRNTLKKVVPKEGVTNRAQGWHAPQGLYIGLDVANTHHDPDIYPRPFSYEAFRFCSSDEAQEKHDAADGMDDKTRGEQNATADKKTTLATTSETWLAFSHGKRACPARQFVAAYAKILLSFMVMNYDVKPLATRPPSRCTNGFTIDPPWGVNIKVRRKAGPVTI